MSLRPAQEEGKAFSVGLPDLASLPFVRPKGERKTFAVGLPSLGLAPSLPSLCRLGLEEERRGKTPSRTRRLGGQFCFKRHVVFHGKARAENLGGEEGDFSFEREGFFVRRGRNFSSEEGRFPFGQKEVSFRRGWALSSEGNYFSCGRKGFPLRKERGRKGRA